MTYEYQTEFTYVDDVDPLTGAPIMTAIPQTVRAAKQGIPYHPNCRCRWKAILSALGIKAHQKAAVDANGGLYYTKAQTYDEYAKEVGLPSVRDMVNNDNPKKYLRPGETVEDLRRRVQRKTFISQVGNKHTIIVPDKSCLVDKNSTYGILRVNTKPDISTGLYRKTKNTGVFGVLEEPVQKRHVERLIQEAGYDYSGIHIKVRHNEELLGTGFLGYTYPDGNTVEFYPDAFASRESLIKTIVHEKKHVEQIRLHGPTTGIEDGLKREKEAYAVEAEAWEKYKKGRR